MKSGEEIKQEVRERYGAAVASGGGCCKNSREMGELALPCDRVVATAGYTQEELRIVPQEALDNSFGCGNPLAFAGVLPGQTVLDIGSGAGIDCFLAAEKVGPHGRVIGIDMTPAMIEKARANARKAGVTNLEFRLGEAEKMPVESGTVDWIISNCVINLSPDKPAVFREAFRVLRPEGRISISDIMVEKLPWLLRRSTALYTSCVAGAIPEAQYVDGLRQAGFVDVEVTQRLVYERDQIISLIEESRLFGAFTRWLKRPVTALLDRYIVGKVWSAKLTARKPL